MKRWSSGREHLPIFHENRPIIESIFIVAMLSLGAALVLVTIATFIIVAVQ